MNALLVDLPAAREMLAGVSRGTIDRAVKSGELPVVRLGDRVLFRPSDIEEFVASKVVRMNSDELMAA